MRPEYRGKGYGKAAIKKLASIAVERGCGRLEWWCLDWTKPSIDFLPLGAVPMSEWTVYRIAGDTLMLNIPDGFVFDDATIETGAGKVEIDALSADILRLPLGAGEADIKNLTANSRADIEGGAGELNINGGLLRNHALNTGAGELPLKSRIEGKSRLDYGIGETELILLGSREDYQIGLDKGIGEAKLAGKNMRDDSVYGAGRKR